MKTKFHCSCALLALTFLTLLVLPADAQPALGINNDPILGISVYWPVTNAAWSLQWTTDLTTPLPWQPYPDLPVASDDGNSLVLNLASFQATNPMAFFILASNPVIVAAAPTVVTMAADPVRITSAFPNGTIQPNGLDTTWWYQWGTDVSYGNTTPSSVVTGDNTDPVPVQAGVFGLTAGTTYHFQLYGSNVDGITSGGDLTFTTATPLPDAIVETFGASSVTTTTAVLNGSINPNGSGALCRFQWGTDTSYGNTTTTFFPPLQNYDAVTTSSSISGLSPNTTYHYRIIGFNGGPDEVFGDDVMFTTSAPQQQQPPIVVTLAASSVSSNCATLNGTVNPNGAATSCEFGYGIYNPNSYAGISTGEQPAGGDNSVHSFSITVCGLFPNTEYAYAMEAHNSGGAGAANIVHFTTTGSGSQAPPTVQSLATSSVTGSGAILNGSVNPNGASTTVYFEYGTTTSYGTITTQTGIGTMPQSDFQAALTGLAPNSTYHYRVDALNSGGTSHGADVTFTTAATQAPPTVQTLPASLVRTNQAQLNGSVNPNGAATTYYYQYGTTPGYGMVASSVNVGSGTLAQPANATLGLNQNTTYHYRIVAYNSLGTAYGSDMTVTTTNWILVPPLPIAPGTSSDTGFTVSNLTPTFTWTGYPQVASSYDLVILKYPYSSGDIVFDTSITGTLSSYQIPGGVLQAGTKYAWYMVSFNSLGDESGSSGVPFFQTP